LPQLCRLPHIGARQGQVGVDRRAWNGGIMGSWLKTDLDREDAKSPFAETGERGWLS
jgi:hypothetical protein